MPFPIAAVAFWSLAGTYAVKLVVKVLVALGISYVVYEGAEFAVDEAQDAIAANVSGIPADVLDLINLAGFDKALAILFAGWSAMVAVKVAMGVFGRWSKAA